MNNEEIIEDLLKEINTLWSEKERKEFFLTPWKQDAGLSMFHHSFGRYIRNKYKLWERKWTPDIRNGVDYAFDHPDAVSMTIMEEVWKRGSYGQSSQETS